MIARRYQVFLSSTFLDLKAERAEAVQAILELDCMPAGMELFPAANDEQWTWIKKIIDESDYYVVIVGGRYGSVHSQTGLSFTEMEYKYALERNKPIIAFLHADPSEIPVGKSDVEAEAIQKLREFRALCEQKLCKHWTTPTDLAAKLSRSLTQLIKYEPRPGWVRGDQVSEDQQIEILTLRQEARDLKEQIAANARSATSSDDIAGGDDIFEIRYHRRAFKGAVAGQADGKPVFGDFLWGGLEATWKEIFALLSPVLTTNGLERNCVKAFNEAIAANAQPGDVVAPEGFDLLPASIGTQSLDQIRTQLLALGIISVDLDLPPGGIRLSLDDSTLRLWRLTEKGRIEVARSAALKKGERRAKDPKILMKKKGAVATKKVASP